MQLAWVVISISISQKPKNTYETKAMKLSRVKNEPIRRTDINAILKNSR